MKNFFKNLRRKRRKSLPVIKRCLPVPLGADGDLLKINNIRYSIYKSTAKSYNI